LPAFLHIQPPKRFAAFFGDRYSKWTPFPGGSLMGATAGPPALVPSSPRASFRMVRFFVCSAALALLPMVAAAEEPAASADVSYFKQVLPIFRAKNCTGCHQPAKRGGDYVMTDFATLLKGGESGTAAVVAGKPTESELLAQITPKDGKAAMPKDGTPVTDAELALIKKWIEQGAKNDTPASNMLRYDAEHPPEYLAPPVLKAVKFSPAGDVLAVAGYHEVLLHKPDGSGMIARLVGESERIEAIAFSPDGTQLAACGGSPGRFGEVQIWDIAKRELKLSKIVGFDTIYGVSWSPNGKVVGFGCSDNTMRGIDPVTGEQVLYSGAHNDWVLDTVFSVNSDHIITVSRDMSMKLVEVGTQRFVDNLTSITPGALKGGLIAIDRHPTKDELVCAGSADRRQRQSAKGIPRSARSHFCRRV
jgi:mono/diheme cytochrome c family protein